MDKASAHGAGDCRLESYQDHMSGCRGPLVVEVVDVVEVVEVVGSSR